MRGFWQRLRPRLRRLSHGQGAAILVLLGLLVGTRLGFAWQATKNRIDYPQDWRKRVGDGFTYDQPARNMLDGHGYSNSFSPPYRPSCLRTPSYPLVLAGVYAVFERDTRTVRTLNAGLDIAACLLFFGMARRLLKPWTSIAFFASVIALSPATLFVSKLLSESLATFLGAFWCYVWVVWPKRRFAAGAILGALILCRPVFALFPIALLVWMAFVEVGTFRHRVVKRMAWFVLGLSLVWTPWIVRNAVVFGRFVPLTPGGSGTALFLGTFAPKAGEMHSVAKRRDGTTWRRLPETAFSNARERRLGRAAFQAYLRSYLTTGDLALARPDKILGKLAMRKIKANPKEWFLRHADFAWEVLKQPSLFYRYQKHHPELGYRARNLLAFGLLFGTLLAFRKVWWHPPLLLFFYSWAVYFPTHYEARYLAPTYCLAMLGGFFVIDWVYGHPLTIAAREGVAATMLQQSAWLQRGRAQIAALFR